MIVCFLNSGNPLFGIIEDNFDITLGALLTEQDKTLISGNKISFVNGRLIYTPMQINIKVIKDMTEDDVLTVFEETVKNYGNIGYIYDNYELYEYNTESNAYKEIDKSDFEMCECSHCGKKIFKKDIIEGFCAECFVEYGVQKCMDEAKATIGEDYTENESISEVCEIADYIKNKLGKYFVSMPEVKMQAAKLVSNYACNKKVEKYTAVVLGGLK